MLGTRETLYTSFLLLAPILTWHYYKTRIRRGIVHPPSPLSLPLFGNLLSLPSGPEHIIYMKLGKELQSEPWLYIMSPIIYMIIPKIGDIIYLDLLGHDIVVLNSPQVALELLDKRSSIYSDRFCPLMFQDKSLYVFRVWVRVHLMNRTHHHLLGLIGPQARHFSDTMMSGAITGE